MVILNNFWFTHAYSFILLNEWQCLTTPFDVMLVLRFVTTSLRLEN